VHRLYLFVEQIRSKAAGMQTWSLIVTNRPRGELDASEIVISLLPRSLLLLIMTSVHVMMSIAMICLTDWLMPSRPLPVKVSIACQAINTTSACAPRPKVCQRP